MIICLSNVKQIQRFKGLLRMFLKQPLHYHCIESPCEYLIDHLDITICEASKRHVQLATHKILPGNMIQDGLYLVINIPMITIS